MPNVYSFKDFEGSSHRILIDLIRRYAPQGGTLLDLGAAGGDLSWELRDHFTRRIGFEFDTDRLAELRGRLDGIVIADLENVERLPAQVDAAVLADIIEHLRRPPELLGLVRESLAPNGRLFVSVPNIANVTVRIGLMLGIFEYRERGILDETHLRFYTMRTIKRDIERAGFKIVAIRGSSVPIRLILPWMPDFLLRLGEKVLAIVTQWWRGLLAYQIIVVAQRR